MTTSSVTSTPNTALATCSTSAWSCPGSNGSTAGPPTSSRSPHSGRCWSTRDRRRRTHGTRRRQTCGTRARRASLERQGGSSQQLSQSHNDVGVDAVVRRPAVDVDLHGPVACRALLLLSCGLVAFLVLFIDGYGYHRYELYFIAIGGHPAWGYVDQPPLIPMLAHAMDTAFGHSLVMLRLPAALAAGGVALTTGLIARELRG